ncbi:hypothetical protein J3L18_10795 [Mucilaginibacter gossypii]|uniref:hypothetical protein n=1 Tax=Mucilaginibacter gossypii TaxID=551996 RepID=UPI000DCC3A7F|nr:MULTISPECIES: hypothetical protein [Mucilaginibacter]QTE39514.1 hypothetical protein J3L18_10795 [Mucilaginibacter gossypii]RAV56124.1 hypothetical protein DIU36_15325 [Mucilaginibacter rubeus]
MEPILIVAYPERIALEQLWLDSQIAYFQAIYDLFKSVGITVTLNEINHVREEILNPHSKEHLFHDLVVNKMLEKAGNPHFNGIAIKKHAFKEMIDIPDVHFIRKWIHDNPVKPISKRFTKATGGVESEVRYGHERHQSHLSPDLFEIVQDVVQRKPDTNDKVTEKYTHYTKNDKGVQTYNVLLDWRDHVIEVNNQLEQIKATFRIEPFGLDKHPDGVMRPSLKVIRDNEARYPADYIPD